jgi:hypothetical protein
MIFGWRAQFGIRQRWQTELAAVFSDAEHGGEPAAAVETLDLQNLLPVPNGMDAVELADGRKILAATGSDPDAVRKHRRRLFAELRPANERRGTPTRTCAMCSSAWSYAVNRPDKLLPWNWQAAESVKT